MGEVVIFFGKLYSRVEDVRFGEEGLNLSALEECHSVWL